MPKIFFRILLLLLIVAATIIPHTVATAHTTTTIATPTDSSTYRATYYDSQNRIRLVINLYAETINVPGFSFIGPTHGYMSGNIYGIWIITSCRIHSDGTATLHLSNDQGADSQTVRLTPQPDNHMNYEAVNGNEIKRVQGRKLVKIPQKLNFVKQ